MTLRGPLHFSTHKKCEDHKKVSNKGTVFSVRNRVRKKKVLRSRGRTALCRFFIIYCNPSSAGRRC